MVKMTNVSKANVRSRARLTRVTRSFIDQQLPARRVNPKLWKERCSGRKGIRHNTYGVLIHSSTIPLLLQLNAAPAGLTSYRLELTPWHRSQVILRRATGSRLLHTIFINTISQRQMESSIQPSLTPKV